MKPLLNSKKIVWILKMSVYGTNETNGEKFDLRGSSTDLISCLVIKRLLFSL